MKRLKRLSSWQKVATVIGSGLFLLAILGIIYLRGRQERVPIYGTYYDWQCTRPFPDLEQCNEVCWEEGGRVPYCAPVGNVFCCSKDWVRYGYSYIISWDSHQESIPVYGICHDVWCPSASICPETACYPDCKSDLCPCSWCGSWQCCEKGQCQVAPYICIVGYAGR